MVWYGRVRARIDGAAANGSSQGTDMLINTFENSERAYSQDSWILIRPLHSLAAASAPEDTCMTPVARCASARQEGNRSNRLVNLASPVGHKAASPADACMQ